MNRIKACVYTNVGNVRSNHEDNYLLGKNQFITPEMQSAMRSNLHTEFCGYDGYNGIFAVCDGMGGHRFGEVASLLSVKRLNGQYEQLLNMSGEQIISSIAALNRYICGYCTQQSEPCDMGTTLSMLIMQSRAAYIVNVGDSRIYLYRGGRLCKKTTDHTEGQRLLDMNLLSDDELEKFPARKSLYKYIGRKTELIADVQRIDYCPHDIFMISSDGLTDTLSEPQIQAVFAAGSSLSSIGGNLMTLALSQGEKCADNVTVLLAEIV